MIKLKELTNACDKLLKTQPFADRSHNGLQVEVHDQVKHVGLAVSANQATFAKAHAQGCDTLLVHHGLFWSNNWSATGLLGQRLKLLYEYQLNLLAYHLPLDVHPIYGNNATLGALLGLQANPVVALQPLGIVYQADFFGNKYQLQEQLQNIFSVPMSVFDFGPAQIETVAWCSGAGGDFMEMVKADCFITGEVTERHYEQARELGVHLISVGHYQSERLGVLSLAQWLEKELKLETSFIEVLNPL